MKTDVIVSHVSFALHSITVSVIHLDMTMIIANLIRNLITVANRAVALSVKYSITNRLAKINHKRTDHTVN